MKAKYLFCVALALSANFISAEETVLERGPHHQIHETVSERGEEGVETNRFTLIQPGINYWSNAELGWVPSSDQIDLVAQGAEFTKGAFKARFSPDFNNPFGCVELTLPDGRKLRIQTIGLVLTDKASGRSVWIGEPKNSEGVLMESGNTVIYEDVFTGTKADIRIVVGIGKFTSDVILREQLPEIRDLNLDPDTTFLEVWHEIIESPALRLQNAKIQRANGLTDKDQQLDFGSMVIGPGTAFMLGGNQVPLSTAHDQLAVAKEVFEDSEANRRYLIEAVPVREASPHIRLLPVREEARVSPDRLKAEARIMHASASPEKRNRPTRIPSLTGAIETDTKIRKPRQVASIKSGFRPSTPGYLIDYTIVATASGVTFNGATTYYVTNAVTLTGTTTLEAGSVIKFMNNGVAAITINGPFVCKTEPYLPAVFTARLDTQYGEAISAGSVSGIYADYALKFTSGAANLKNVIFRYAKYGVSFQAASQSNVIQNAQFYQCAYPIHASGSTLSARNVLISGASSNVFSATSATLFGENLTIDNSPALLVQTGSTLALTNTILSSITDTNGYTGSFNRVAADGTFTAGSTRGNYYLSDATFRNAGTPNVYGLNELRRSTTVPPTVITTDFTTDTVLSPIVALDTDVPDLGFHYQKADYCFGGRTLTAKLTLTNGVVVAYHSTQAITIGGGGKVYSTGKPDQPNRLIRYGNIQEQPASFGDGGISSVFNLTSSVSADVRLKFTEVQFIAMGDVRKLFANFNNATLNPLILSDFRSDGLWQSFLTLNSGSTLTLQNCLFGNSTLVFGVYTNYPSTYAFYELDLYNTLFNSGSVTFSFNYPYTPAWTIKDNLFNSTTLVNNSSASLIDVASNGYRSGLTSLGGTNNWTGLVADFVSGPLGEFYYPTFGSGTSLATLKDVGSRTATSAGLAHHTASGNTKETGQVDIGYHYVATQEELWVDDSPLTTLAPGATAWAGEDGWNWVTSSPSPVAGTQSHSSPVATGTHQHYFDGVTNPFAVDFGDILFGYVYPSTSTPPNEVMLQWKRAGDSWGWLHRGYWMNGATELTGFGTDGTDAMRRMGTSPPTGQWVRLEVPAKSVGLEGRAVNGMGFTLSGGAAHWDRVGKTSRLPIDTDGDGLPDYVEDTNGDGSATGDATSWTAYDSLNGLASSSDTRIYTPLKP